MSRAEVSPINPQLTRLMRVELPQTHDAWMALRQRALDTAVLNPDIPNYVSLPWANKHMSPDFDRRAQDEAAAVVCEAFPGMRPDLVLGIGHSGVPFARAVRTQLSRHLDPHDKLDVPPVGFCEVQNLADLPESEQRFMEGYDGFFSAHSYSRGRNVNFFLPHLEGVSSVFIVDDVSAQGSISESLVAELRRRQPEIDIIGFATYFAKDWQHGLQRFTGNTGIPSFAVIRIGGLSEKGIRLTGEFEAQSKFLKATPLHSELGQVVSGHHRRYPTSDIDIP